MRSSLIMATSLLMTLAACQQDAESPTGPELKSASATAGTLSFRQISAGDQHNCGVTTDNKAYCWGANGFGQLGNGPGGGTTSPRPVAVLGDLAFREVSAGVFHTCGVTLDDRAYCWGYNDDGQLGDGTTTRRSAPVPVAGGRRFRQVSVGRYHSCAINNLNVAYCWGYNRWGQMGTGTVTNLTPVRVLGGLRFDRISAGWSHTCAATTDDKAYCWGHSRGTTPTPVAGGISFRTAVAGSGYISSAGSPNPDYTISCGVTPVDRAYCWAGGSSAPGESPGYRFRLITPGAFHVCAINTLNVAYCWGSNDDGQTGTNTRSDSPVRVLGGLRWIELSASGVGRHTCGVTTDNRAYCWGVNDAGQLGDGTTTKRTTATPVLGPS